MAGAGDVVKLAHLFAQLSFVAQCKSRKYGSFIARYSCVAIVNQQVFALLQGTGFPSFGEGVGHLPVAGIEGARHMAVAEVARIVECRSEVCGWLHGAVKADGFPGFQGGDRAVLGQIEEDFRVKRAAGVSLPTGGEAQGTEITPRFGSDAVGEVSFIYHGSRRPRHLCPPPVIGAGGKPHGKEKKKGQRTKPGASVPCMCQVGDEHQRPYGCQNGQYIYIRYMAESVSCIGHHNARHQWKD